MQGSKGGPTGADESRKLARCNSKEVADRGPTHKPKSLQVILVLHMRGMKMMMVINNYTEADGADDDDRDEMIDNDPDGR